MSRPRERFLDSVRRRLTELRDLGRRREMRCRPGIDFGSNDYLGLARSAVAESAIAGSTGSRLLSGHSEAWERCEKELANWHSPDGSLHTLYFPSGYVANEGLLATLIEREDRVFSDALNHGSIIDGLRLSRASVSVFPHQDFDRLAEQLAAAPSGGRRFVVTESLFGMDGDITDLVRLASICDAHEALLVVDEAHATGCYGETGAGLIEAQGVRQAVFASIHTCGKALGSHGAYVVVDPEVRDYLVQACRHFIFTTSLPDFVAEATLQHVAQIRSSDAARFQLARNTDRVRKAIHDRFPVVTGGSELGHVVPVLLEADERAVRWTRALSERGLWVPAIRAPAVPEGRAILRASIRAGHTFEELDQLVAALLELSRSEPR